MTAHNDKFPWMSYYKNYNFFEDRMRQHSNIDEMKRLEIGVYKLTQIDGKIIKVFICECYSYDVAEYYETIEKLGKVDAIIINSNWCSYTLEAKRYCRDNEVGLFNIQEFMTAINRRKYWEYLTTYENEQFRKKGWI